jgi:hypothetical protein
VKNSPNYSFVGEGNKNKTQTSRGRSRFRMPLFGGKIMQNAVSKK